MDEQPQEDPMDRKLNEYELDEVDAFKPSALIKALETYPLWAKNFRDEVPEAFYEDSIFSDSQIHIELKIKELLMLLRAAFYTAPQSVNERLGVAK